MDPQARFEMNLTISITTLLSSHLFQQLLIMFYCLFFSSSGANLFIPQYLSSWNCFSYLHKVINNFLRITSIHHRSLHVHVVHHTSIHVQLLSIINHFIQMLSPQSITSYTSSVHHKCCSLISPVALSIMYQHWIRRVSS